MNDLQNELAQYIDLMQLQPTATGSHIDQICREAVEHGFYAVCLHAGQVERAKARLEGSEVKVVSVVGFPLGATDPDVKRFETEAAVDLGADEVEVVPSLGRLKEGEEGAVFRELRDIVEAAEERVVKVILETCLLSDAEKQTGCRLAAEAGVHFVNTSTGFSHAGATVEDVRLLRGVVQSKLGVKASGGIRDAATAVAMLRAGANRLGCSSGVEILQDMGRFESGPLLEE